jgi:hypothetical protein
MDRRTIRRASGLIAIALTSAVLAACSTAGGTSAPSQPAAASTAPAASMSTVASGTLHAVDGTASGTVALIHLADGSLELSFEDFSIASAAHTNVALVMNSDVMKSADVDPKALLDLGPLKSATGMQEFSVPASMAGNAMSYHTVLIWDTQMLHAVAAAPLR